MNLVVAALILAGLGLASRLQLTPDGTGLALPGSGRRLPELCAVKRATGRPCAGCGAGRAFVLALRGEPVRAWGVHPTGVLYAAWAGAQLVLRSLLALPWRGRPSSRFVASEVAVSLGALCLLPFTGLAR